MAVERVPRVALHAAVPARPRSDGEAEARAAVRAGEAEAGGVRDLSAAAAEIGAIGVVDLGCGGERRGLGRAREGEAGVGLERFAGRVVEPEVGLLGGEVVGVAP